MSNFALKNFISDPDGAFVSANTKELKDKAYQTYVVSASEARRLDLVSYKIYKTVDLKWLLIYVNDIYDLDLVTEGFVLKYPRLTDVISYMMRSMEARASD